MQKTTTQGYSKQNNAANLPTSMKFLDKHAIAKQSNRKARENEYEFGMQQTQQTIANQNMKIANTNPAPAARYQMIPNPRFAARNARPMTTPMIKAMVTITLMMRLNWICRRSICANETWGGGGSVAICGSVI